MILLDELKSEAEKLVSVLRDVIGNSEFNLIHARVNDHFYKKRNLNKAKKKEKVLANKNNLSVKCFDEFVNKDKNSFSLDHVASRSGSETVKEN